jgi:hypothetical protein
VTTNERPIVVQQRISFISPRAIAAALITLISAGFYFWYIVSLQSRLREVVTEAESKQVQVRQQVESLTLDHGALEDVAKLLTRVTIEDRSGLDPTLKETLAFVSSAETTLDKVGEEIEIVHASEKSAFIWDLKRAISRASGAVTTLNVLQRNINATRSKQATVLAELSSVLREETSALHQEVRAFYFTLAAVLQDLEQIDDASVPVSRDVAIVQTDAMRLARIAGLVYSPQSLVQKRIDLERKQPSLSEVARSVVVLPNDRKAVADARIAGRITPAPRLASNLKGPAWRVTAAGLNVRNAPSSKAYVVCALTHNDSVTVVINNGDWWNVETRCGQGWVSSKHLAR